MSKAGRKHQSTEVSPQNSLCASANTNLVSAGGGEVGGRVQGTDMECVVADDEVMLSVVTGRRANLGRD